MAQMISFWRYIHAVCRTDACGAAKRQVCREKLWNAAFLWDCRLYWPVKHGCLPPDQQMRELYHLLVIRGTASPAASASAPVQTLSPDQFSLHSAYSGGEIENCLNCFIQLFPAIKHQLNLIRPKPAAERHDTEEESLFGGFVFKPVYGLMHMPL